MIRYKCRYILKISSIFMIYENTLFKCLMKCLILQWTWKFKHSVNFIATFFQKEKSKFGSSNGSKAPHQPNVYCASFFAAAISVMFLGSIMVIVNVYELRSLHGEQMGLLLQVSDELQQHDCPQKQPLYTQDENNKPTLLVWSPRVIHIQEKWPS